MKLGRTLTWDPRRTRWSTTTKPTSSCAGRTAARGFIRSQKRLDEAVAASAKIQGAENSDRDSDDYSREPDRARVGHIVCRSADGFDIEASSDQAGARETADDQAAADEAADGQTGRAECGAADPVETEREGRPRSTTSRSTRRQAPSSSRSLAPGRRSARIGSTTSSSTATSTTADSSASFRTSSCSSASTAIRRPQSFWREANIKDDPVTQTTAAAP